MASSGSINTSSYEGRYLQLSWTQTKDVANNRSTIKWTLSSIGGTEVYYSTGATTVKINGTQVYYKDRMDWTTYAFPAAKGSVSGTTTINHASDGTGSIKVELSTAIWYYAIDSYSKTWTLDTIPRASTPTLSASSVNIGSAVTINTNRASSAFTHTIRYEWAGTSGTIATGVGSSYSWTIPTSFASNIPNATSGTCKVYVDTYNGSTKIGTKSVNLTAKVPDADWTKPKINSVTISPSGNPDWVGSRYVQSKTKARVVTGTTGQAGATIKTCEVTIDGTKYTGTDITSNAIRISGTVSATIKVTDSRGYTNSTTRNISVEAYGKPYIANHSTQNKIICARCNDSGTLVSNGTRLRLMLSKKWYALSGGVNTAQVQYQINSNGWVTASAHTTNAPDIALTVTNITLDLKQTYKVYIKISDKFGDTETYEYNIPTEEIAFNLKEGGHGAAFGKYAEEEDMLDIAWKIKNNSVPTLLGGLGSTIPSNSNLNSVNFLVPGNYVCALNDTAKTLTNSPTSYAFKMCVYNCLDTFQDAYNGDWMYMVREITNLDGTSWIQFVRREGGNWNYGNWRIILDSGNCPDYVIEQGTVDGWEYTKWKNGKMELFSAKSLSFPASEKQTDYLWRSIVSLDLSKYLTKIMSGTCCIQTNGMIPQVCRHSTNLTTAEIVIVTSRTFSAFTITAPIYIIGKWK